MKLIPLTIHGISYSQTQTGSYALLLKEGSTQRQIPIIIGGNEARSIAVALDKNIHMPKPFTHDLFVNFSRAFHIDVKSVVIYKLVDGLFFSHILFKRESIQERIDSRTSDAIALAIRFQAPIYTTKEIFEKASMDLDADKSFDQSQFSFQPLKFPSEKKITENSVDLKKMTKPELVKFLSRAIEREDYKLAALVKVELDKRV